MHAEHFRLDRTSQGIWAIRHHITDLPAGTLHFNGTHFILTTSDDQPAGSYNTIDDAIEALYGSC